MENESTDKLCGSTLFSFARQSRDGTVDLEDPGVMAFTDGFRLDMGDADSQLELVTLLFHSEDLEVQRWGENEPVEEGCATRYFADNVLCYTCGQIGHQERRCPRNTGLFCILCASEGHYKYNCPQRVCLSCYKCGHIAKDCREKSERRRYAMCRQCTSGEHSVMDCPLVWRTYSLARTPRGKVAKSCPLCFSSRHFADDCSSRRTKFSIFSSDFCRIAQAGCKRR